LRIIPFKDIEDIKSIIAPIQGYIQTIGLACNENLYLQYSQVLLQQGTCRITQIGSMGRGSVGEPHDGAYDFPQFLRLTSIGWKPPRKSLTPYDCMDAESKEYIINSNFKKLISSAKRSQFYSKILKEIELNTIHDLPKIPILTRDVWEKEMAEWNTLETKKSEGGYLTRSGGTTGTPKYSMTDGHDWEAMVNHAVTMFNACGFYAEDRIANFMAAGDLYGSFISFNHVNYKLGAMSFAYASNYNTESFLEHWRKFKINSIQGFPTQLAILFHECLKLDIHFKIEKIMYAGLPMSETDKTWFREKCGVKIISSVIGTTETNQIGYQCEHLKGNEHHLTDDYNYVEIVGENGNVIPTEEVGRIVVTNLQKHNFPIIRYSIGDSGRILQKKCNCGKADRVFEYLGRWDDQVSMGMMNLSYQDTLVALQAFPISSLQIQISYYKQKDLFELLVETSDNYSEDLKLNITKELTLKLRGFKYHLEKEDFIFNLKLLPIGTILRNERTGKVKSILDLRQDKTSN
jgi:phenylacetate-CoA ligase